MTGGPAEGRGIGVIPAIYPTNQHGNCQDGQYGIGEDAERKLSVAGGKNMRFNQFNNLFIVSSGKQIKVCVIMDITRPSYYTIFYLIYQ